VCSSDLDDTTFFPAATDTYDNSEVVTVKKHNRVS